MCNAWRVPVLILINMDDLPWTIVLTVTVPPSSRRQIVVWRNDIKAPRALTITAVLKSMTAASEW
jgi:hypothetical protein